MCGVSWAGFRCPSCCGTDAWPTARGQLRCNRCQRQTSVTAGTIFEGTRKPLRLWFQAMWYVTNQKHGVSALGLQRILGLGSYQTAWAWLHKLRRAMVRPGRDLLGGAVEVDETYVGGRETGVVGRQTKTKSIVAIAAEVRGRGTGRIRMSRVEDVAARSLIPFVQTTLARPSEPMAGQPTVVWRTKAMTTSRDPFPPVATRPTSSCHECIAWPLCLIAGGWASTMVPSMPTISTTISTSSLSDSIAAVRRLVAFLPLLQQAVQHEPVPYKGLVGGHRSLGNQM